jgi:BirA family biotin operon repressor/biotin-[acetyl-CoA-carboxylase] ligase
VRTGGLTGRVVGRRVIALDEVDSTQLELARLAAGDTPEGTVVTARHQRRGRGRQGRRWWDEPGQSLLVSVLLRPPVAVAQAPQLSHVGALAVTDALAAAGVEAGIRWPNDIVIRGGKVCGILPDAVSDSAGRLRHVLLGIGVNVNQTTFPESLASAATSLRLATGREHDSAALLVAIVDALDVRYARYLAGGFAGLRADWRGRAISLGTMITTPTGREGTAEDISPEGALLVRLDDGRLVPLWSGEIAKVARDV